MLNLAAVSGICAITESGTCPLSLSNLKLDVGTVGTDSALGASGAFVSVPANNFPHVPSPTIPSAVRPFKVCHSLTLTSVPGPKLPSGVIPNLVWSFLTSSPVDPFLSSIVLIFYFFYISNFWAQKKPERGFKISLLTKSFYVFFVIHSGIIIITSIPIFFRHRFVCY